MAPPPPVMPWDLVLSNGTRRRLYPGVYTLGRKQCAIVIDDDPSISRLHATLRVDPLPAKALGDPALQPELYVVDSSRFGTTVEAPGAEPLPASSNEAAPTLVPDGSTLRFGTQGAQTVVEYSPLVACGAALDAATAASSAVHAAQLGMHLLPAWHDSCTLLLVPGAAGTAARAATSPAAVCALYSAAPAVSVAWLATAAASGGAEDPASSMAEYCVALADAAGAPLVAAAFPPRAGMLLRGVSLLFGPPAAGGPQPPPDLAPLAAALCPADADLAAAVRLAGGAAARVGDAAAVEFADAAARGERGILLLLRADGGARLRGTPWAAAAATDSGRVMTALLSGALGGLQAPATGAPPRVRVAPTPAPAAAEGSDTEEGVEGGGKKPSKAAPAASVQPRPGGFVSFVAGQRGRGGAAAEAAAAAPAAVKGKKKGKGPAAVALTPAGLAAAEDDAAEELVDPEFMGAVVLDATLFARQPGAVAAAPDDAQQARRGATQDALPNFKRFRKVALLPSSSTFGLLVPYEAEPDAFTAVDDYAEETRAAKELEARARQLFVEGAAAAKKAKAK